MTKGFREDMFPILTCKLAKPDLVGLKPLAWQCTVRTNKVLCKIIEDKYDLYRNKSVDCTADLYTAHDQKKHKNKTFTDCLKALCTASCFNIYIYV